jgi:DNA mismatch repair ATPase MutL
VHTSVYLPKSVHRKLKEIAFHTDRKIHDIIMEGIDETLKRHGHPTSAELKANAKAP